MCEYTKYTKITRYGWKVAALISYDLPFKSRRKPYLVQEILDMFLNVVYGRYLKVSLFD